MTEPLPDYGLILLITGGIIAVTAFTKAGLKRTLLPPLIGFLTLGFLIRLTDSRFQYLGSGSREILGFMANIGLITLLFRVGLESNLQGLLKQLRRASILWIGDVMVSGLLGFVAAFYLLNLSWITSLIVATALTATSVGISVSVWEDEGALRSSNGELLIDVAELDDISAVVLMALLFSVLPLLQDGSGKFPAALIGKTAALFFLKLLGFGGFCYVFARYVEARITGFFASLKAPPDPSVVVVAISFIIAALADVLGFSLAIGAFFAGLVFSRDPRAVKMEASFLPLYELFSPFFFIGIGMDIAPDKLTAALGLGTVLVVVAVAGKFLAVGLPVWKMWGVSSGLLIGISMFPRAEIAMVIMQRALHTGEWAVSPSVFGAMVLVSAVTCTASPLAVKALLRKWPQRGDG